MDDLEKKFYGIAAAEVAAKRFEPAIMAKAYADSKGDEKRAIAAYISLRFADLVAEHKRPTEEKARRRSDLWTECKHCGHRGKMERSLLPGGDHAYFSGIAVVCTKCGFHFDWHDVGKEF